MPPATAFPDPEKPSHELARVTSSVVSPRFGAIGLGFASRDVSERAELREPALLKLFFGSDPKRLAGAQIPAHREKLAEYEAIRDAMPAEVPAGPRQALEAGIRYEREMLRYWQELAG